MCPSPHIPSTSVRHCPGERPSETRRAIESYERPATQNGNNQWCNTWTYAARAQQCSMFSDDAGLFTIRRLCLGRLNKKVYKNTACRLTYMPKWCSSVFCGGWKKVLNNGHQRQPCPEHAQEALEGCCNSFPPAGSFEFKAGFRSSLILTGPKLTLNSIYGPPSQTQMKAGLS